MAARHFCWKPGKNGKVGVKGPEGSIKNTISVIWEQSKPVHSMHHWLWLKNMPSSAGLAMAPSHRRAHYITLLIRARRGSFIQRKIYYWIKHGARMKTQADMFFFITWGLKIKLLHTFSDPNYTWPEGIEFLWLFHWTLCNSSTLAENS